MYHTGPYETTPLPYKTTPLPYETTSLPPPPFALFHTISNSTTIIPFPLYVTDDHNKMNHSAKII